MIRSTALTLLIAGTALPAMARDDVLDVVAPFEIKGADPIQSGSILIKMDVIETLVDVSAGGQLEPGLATDWEVSEDGRNWTFSLRSGVTFHNGNPDVPARHGGLA